MKMFRVLPDLQKGNRIGSQAILKADANFSLPSNTQRLKGYNEITNYIFANYSKMNFDTNKIKAILEETHINSKVRCTIRADHIDSCIHLIMTFACHFIDTNDSNILLAKMLANIIITKCEVLTLASIKQDYGIPIITPSEPINIDFGENTYLLTHEQWEKMSITIDAQNVISLRFNT